MSDRSEVRCEAVVVALMAGGIGCGTRYAYMAGKTSRSGVSTYDLVIRQMFKFGLECHGPAVVAVEEID